MKTPVFRYASLHALGAAAYVAAVAIFLFSTSRLFPDSEPSVLIPMAMILLLVFSAALMGILVFGRPIMWYLDGKKKEALSLLFSTMGMLFVFVVIAFVALALSKR